MKRLTLKNVHEMNMTELALNQVYIYDGWTWYRKAPEDECSACGLIRKMAKTLDVDLEPELTDDELGDVMLDWLQYGETEPEGVLAILYRALWAMAEVRERLKLYEDICFAEDGTELLTPWALQVLRGARESLRNDPLTLEELLEMKGKPVFIKSKYAHESTWRIFLRATDQLAFFNDYVSHGLDAYGKTWWAYRRPLEKHANAE